MSENQVTKTSKKAVAIPKELLGSFMEDAGAGTENISADDMKIPFIRIIQPTSPEVKKKDEKYIEGAQASNMGRRGHRYSLRVHQKVFGVCASRKGWGVPR